jgi:hypothetical protein
MYVGPIRAHIGSILGTGAIFPSDCFVVSVCGRSKATGASRREGANNFSIVSRPRRASHRHPSLRYRARLLGRRRRSNAELCGSVSSENDGALVRESNNRRSRKSTCTAVDVSTLAVAHELEGSLQCVTRYPQLSSHLALGNNPSAYICSARPEAIVAG